MPKQPDKFLALPAPFYDYRLAKYAVLPVPYDSTVSFHIGTQNGHRAILTASQPVELFVEEHRREFCKAGVATPDRGRVGVADVGVRLTP